MFSKTPELQVICEVSDGIEAVHKAEELQPDLILLDVGLPGLNGIEAARQVRKLAPQSKILFVSQESSVDVIEEALGLGAMGYVIKARAATELLTAVTAVLRGDGFVSSRGTDPDSINPEVAQTAEHARRHKLIASSRHRCVERSRHQLRLYSDDAAFVNDYAHSIEAALENGNTVVVIATESHREALLQRLRADGVDVEGAAERKLYIPLDVFGVLPTAMDISSGEDEFSEVVPQSMVEVLRMADETHLHFTVG
jgi:DNA-binding NarL/FixJ family response regulator